MIKPVSGYQTKDGSFFESKKAAAIHEAEQELRRVCASVDMTEDIVDFIREHIMPVQDFVYALSSREVTREENPEKDNNVKKISV